MSTIFNNATRNPYVAASHSNLVEQKWSAEAFKHGLASNPLVKYMGTGDDSIIQIKKDLMKSAGDNIVFHLRALLAGAGQGDDGTLEGNEEALVYHDTSLTVHERGNAVKVNGIMTEQRTSIPLRSDAKNALGEWIGRVQAADTIAALSGVDSTKTFAGQMTGAQALDASSSGILTVNTSGIGTDDYKQYGYGADPTDGGRIFYGGQNSSGKFKLLSGDSTFTAASSDEERFGTRVIKFVKKMAEASIQVSGTVINPIRPVMVDGDKYYLMLISPNQAYDLKKETAWNEAQKHANIRGKTNPIFSGALGIYDGVVIKVCDLIHTRYGKNGTTASEFFMSTDDVVTSSCYVSRALFLGAQAGLMGVAKLPTWKEKMFDFGAKFGIATRMIYGTKRPKFNSVDFGCIAVDTQVDPDAA